MFYRYKILPYVNARVSALRLSPKVDTPKFATGFENFPIKLFVEMSNTLNSAAELEKVAM